MTEEINRSLERLRAYVEKQDYAGWDLYDTLLSPFPFHWLGKWGPVLATQFQKRNPVNIRPLLGIPIQRNPKGIGLFLSAYLHLFQQTGNQEFLASARHLFNWLKENRSQGYSGTCWGYNFPWAGPEKKIAAYTPSSVVTGFVIRGIHEFYRQTGSEEAWELMLDAVGFILHDLPLTEDSAGICFSYTPVMKDQCYNASLLAAEVLARAYSVEGNDTLKEKALAAAGFVTRRQHADGRWNYSYDENTGAERKQVDFHQGYVIESLHTINQLCRADSKDTEEAIRKGLEFYSREQFFPDGRSKWRLPKESPVEIHNQSQGIITFARFKNYGNNYLEQARTIANWTITNMQAKDGHFYHQVHKHYKIKIPYIRWSQAWMMLALATLTKNHGKD